MSSISRFIALALATSALTPAALAGSPARVAVGPGGLVDDGDPYYVEAGLAPIELPQSGRPDDDCAAGDRPEDPGAAATRIVDPVVNNLPEPGTFHGVSDWFPECVAVIVPSMCVYVCVVAAPPLAYVAHHLSSGRYYVEVFGGSSYSGLAGAAVAADCEACPPGASSG